MTQINLDLIVQSFVDKISKSGDKPLYELTPAEARKVLLNVQKDILPNPDVQIDEYYSPLNGERKMKMYILKPAAATSSLPVIFYIHGGGWVMGGLETHRYLLEQLVLETQCAVVFPEYELSPESQYPQTTDDLFQVLQYVTGYGDSFDLNVSKLVLAGDSVGGNMVAVLALMAHEKGDKPAISFQILLYPVTNASFDDSSYQAYADGPWLTQKAMMWFWKQYAPDISLQQADYASILKIDANRLQGLPPALVVTIENDVLRDEGEAWARKLIEAGVDTACVRVNNTIHDFLMLYDLRESPATKAAMNIVAAYLKQVLN